TQTIYLFPFTTLFRSVQGAISIDDFRIRIRQERVLGVDGFFEFLLSRRQISGYADDFNSHLVELWLVITELGKFSRSTSSESGRSEEHTSELQSRFDL